MGLLGNRPQKYSSADLSAKIYNPMYAPPVEPGGHIIHTSTPLRSRLSVAAATIRTRAAVVSRRPRMLGINFLYSHGGWNSGATLKPPFSGPGSGFVQSSAFQPTTVRLVAASFNNALYGVGYPRNLGFSFKVPTLPTADKANSGGPTNGMRPRGIFTKVQTVPRYSTRPQSYDTVSGGA